VALSAGSTVRNPVTTSRVSKLVLGSDLETIGAAAFDGDRYAVVGPLEHGRVASIRVRPGMEVHAGQVLAEIESAEVGQAQAAYLSAAARRVSSQANLRRETELADRHVSSGRERELAEAQAASEEAELRAARQRLLALGLVRDEIEALAAGSNRAGRVALRAPIDGTVITRSITLGQAVEAATDAFHIADLSRLWVQLDIFEKDVPYVYVGQKADLRTDAWPGEVFAARVAHIEPLIDEHTRTARVRIEFDNLKRRLRPGQFVTAHLGGEPAGNGRVVLAVPRSAVMTIDGRKVVFAEAAAGKYLRRSIELGRVGGELVEVRSGVSEGENVVSDGAFLLKSELAR
jgi:cobalt-zinc-cadmium efflux system membrane fusion protein